MSRDSLKVPHEWSTIHLLRSPASGKWNSKLSTCRFIGTGCTPSWAHPIIIHPKVQDGMEEESQSWLLQAVSSQIAKFDNLLKANCQQESYDKFKEEVDLFLFFLNEL